MPTYAQLKWCSFAHSAVYAALLLVWLVPGWHGAEFVFGLGHGLGWIAMTLASLVALKRGTIGFVLAALISIGGAVGPFIGSGAFVLADRRRPRAAEPPGAGAAGARQPG